MEKKLAFAVDINDLEEAKKVIKEIEHKDIIIKIGYNLFIKGGYGLIDYIKNLGFEIFLDLKLHDIPNTVYNGVLSAKELNIDYLTIHSLGGKEMLEKAYEAKQNSNLKVIAVTILTSHNEEYKTYIKTEYSLKELAFNLAKTAIDIGIDGVVSSAHEVRFLKENINKDFIAVVPGIRFDNNKVDDQQRIATPEEALKNGADIIVVGRPILKAENKNKIIEEIINRMRV